MIAALVQSPGIEWNRMEAFHMDEYLGIFAATLPVFAAGFENTRWRGYLPAAVSVSYYTLQGLQRRGTSQFASIRVASIGLVFNSQRWCLPTLRMR
jgi:hypothetical protein